MSRQASSTNSCSGDPDRRAAARTALMYTTFSAVNAIEEFGIRRIVAHVEEIMETVRIAQPARDRSGHRTSPARSAEAEDETNAAEQHVEVLEKTARSIRAEDVTVAARDRHSSPNRAEPSTRLRRRRRAANGRVRVAARIATDGRMRGNGLARQLCLCRPSRHGRLDRAVELHYVARPQSRFAPSRQRSRSIVNCAA
jgi:hypothetical protein